MVQLASNAIQDASKTQVATLIHHVKYAVLEKFKQTHKQALVPFAMPASIKMKMTKLNVKIVALANFKQTRVKHCVKIARMANTKINRPKQNASHAQKEELTQIKDQPVLPTVQFVRVENTQTIKQGRLRAQIAQWGNSMPTTTQMQSTTTMLMIA